jgi:hypothetical protein
MNELGEPSERLVPCCELPAGDLRDVVLRHGPRSDDYLWPPTSGNAWSRAFLARVLPMPEESYRTCPDLYLCSLAPLYGTIAARREPLGLWRIHGENNTWKQPFVSRVRHYVALWDACCKDLDHHARKLGLTPQPDRWKRESWWHRLDRSADTLIRLIPSGHSFVLIDDDQWGCGELDGRTALPLVERDGKAAGAPADDAQALRELGAQRQRGAEFVVVAWQAFWWLDHYKALANHLQASAQCVLRDDDLAVFRLAGGSNG